MAITISDHRRTLAERQARDAGFADLASYLESLIETVAVRDADRETTVAAVREGLADVAAGRTRPMDGALASIGAKFGTATPCSETPFPSFTSAAPVAGR